MRFYIHIGVEKTGTSSIQDFLSINREELKKLDFFVPKSMGPRNHRKLSIAAFDASRRDDFTRSNNIHTNDELIKFQIKTIAELTAEIKNNSCGKILLTSEQIQSRLTTIPEIKQLLNILTSVGATQVSIIVYLRDPAEIANSNYSTWIRSGATDKEPPGPDHHKYKLLCDHRNTLEKFSSVFGESALIPRIYDSRSFKNGSLIEDFLETIECPLSDNFTFPEPSNKALNPLGIEILRRFNEKIPVFIDDRPNNLRGNINKFINSHFSNNRNDRYFMPDSLFYAYEQAFLKSNEWVRIQWFPEMTCLFEKKDRKKTTPIAFTEKDLDNISGMLIDIWSEKQRQYITQENNTQLNYRILNLIKRLIRKLQKLFKK